MDTPHEAGDLLAMFMLPRAGTPGVEAGGERGGNTHPENHSTEPSMPGGQGCQVLWQLCRGGDGDGVWRAMDSQITGRRVRR